jgi:hypothetical protein
MFINAASVVKVTDNSIFHGSVYPPLIYCLHAFSFSNISALFISRIGELTQLNLWGVHPASCGHPFPHVGNKHKKKEKEKRERNFGYVSSWHHRK